MSDAPIVHLVDDDASFLTALTRLLSAEGFRIRASGSSRQFVDSVTPDARGCVVADLEMPGVNGLELQELLLRRRVFMPFVFLSGRGDIPSSVRAMRGGAVDFLEKAAPKADLIAAIRVALERDVTQHAAHERHQQLCDRFARLTNREREVLQYVVGGKMNKEIAATLNINERTVKLHRTAITTKLGVHSVAQLTTLTHDSRVFEQEPSHASL